LRKYETIFVIDSLLKSEEIDSIIEKYERFISANGGSIETIERWGKKRLAYEIKKRQYGYFVLIRFDGPPTMIRPLEREYRLNESLLRFKTLAMDIQALKALAAKTATAPKPKTEVKEQATPEPKTEPKAEPEEETTEAPAPAAAPVEAVEEKSEPAQEEQDDAQEKKVEE